MQSEAMYAYTFEGRRYDVGDKLGFLQATVEFALKRDELKKPFMEYLLSLNDKKIFKDVMQEVALGKK
jgi:UTP--glucose-1-phosphate uridylyltransferase